MTRPGGGLTLYWIKQYVIRERRRDMRYDVVLGVLVVLFSVMGIAHMVRIVKGALAWYIQTRQAEIRANIAAAEIQKMLSGRARSLGGWR